MLHLRLLCTFLLGWGALVVRAQELPVFDFSTPAAATGWIPAHAVQLSHANGQLRAGITGTDPYFIGPARDYPADLALWLVLDCHSTVGGGAQVFWSGPQPESESRSVRFFVPGGTNARVRVPIPALGRGVRLRLDPPGEQGVFALAAIRFEPRPALRPPQWAAAQPTVRTGFTAVVRAGGLALHHAATGPGAFRIEVDGRPFAMGHPRAPLGYVRDGMTRWFDTGTPILPGPRIRKGPGRFGLESRHRDPDGGVWTIEQQFEAVGQRIRFRSTIRVDADRDIVLVPSLLLLPGVGTFGTNKHQALLSGVEYLENEESSSERDLAGPQARRTVVDPFKLTRPLMALAADDRWISLAWQPVAGTSGPSGLASLFDTPDRVTGSGGHLLGLLHPGADPGMREEGSILPYGGQRLKAGERIETEAWIDGGIGGTVLPAIESDLRRTGLPPLPKPVGKAADFYRLSALGWLESGIRDGDRYRHAVGGGFGSGPAPDAGHQESWLADRVRDPELAGRLKLAAEANAAQVAEDGWMTGLIGHVRTASPALVALRAVPTARSSLAMARRHLDALGPDTRPRYRAPKGGLDLGRTHWTNEANGLTATMLATAFDHALVAGDPALVRECLGHLGRLRRHVGEVPRGAQTWEVPLHTPDILASAYLVKVYVRGYELTGDPEYLRLARDWAWTGVPFVYLHPPTTSGVGAYATTPVLGATQFVAPNWIGLPVQWCGVVYGEALLDLARHDRSLDWTRLAWGIALSGVQQVHPETDGAAKGCLPDSFDLRSQSRNPVPINPGTLLPLAATAYGEPRLHGFGASRLGLRWVVAAGPVDVLSDMEGRLRFRVRAPTGRESQVIVGGVTKETRFRWNGQVLVPDQEAAGAGTPAVVRVKGDGELELRWER